MTLGRGAGRGQRRLGRVKIGELLSPILAHTFSLLFLSWLSNSLPGVSIIPSFASCHSSGFSLHLHGNLFIFPTHSSLIPIPSVSPFATAPCLVCPPLNTTRPSSPSHLTTPLSPFPFQFFYSFLCSVAFNSSRPLCAEWLMAPR